MDSRFTVGLEHIFDSRRCGRYRW